jgi:hypothetical protein
MHSGPKHEISVFSVGFSGHMDSTTNCGLQSNSQFAFQGKVVMVIYIWEGTLNVFALVLFLYGCETLLCPTEGSTQNNKDVLFFVGVPECYYT